MGKGRFVTIWDGVQYRQVSPQEADRLVGKDMAQKMPIDGTAMKFRKDFTGYRTREVRAQPNPIPTPAMVEPPAQPKAQTTEAPVSVSTNWLAHRKAAAKSLGQTMKETTKAQTLTYMEQGLATQD